MPVHAVQDAGPPNPLSRDSASFNEREEEMKRPFLFRSGFIFMFMVVASIIAISLFVLSSLSSCTHQVKDSVTGELLTELQTAKVLSVELSKQYLFLYNQVKDILITGTSEQKTWLYENVTEDLDKAKYILKAYTEMLILWETLGEKPEGLEGKEEEVRQIIETVLLLFLRR